MAAWIYGPLLPGSADLQSGGGGGGGASTETWFDNQPPVVRKKSVVLPKDEGWSLTKSEGGGGGGPAADWWGDSQPSVVRKKSGVSPKNDSWPLAQSSGGGGGGGPPVRTGTPSQIDASAGSGSTTVSVPSDATAVVAFWSHWDGDAGSILSSPTLNGVPFTIHSQLAEGATTGESGTGVATLANPATGSQTFAWNWSAGGARSEGGWIVLVYIKGCDTSDLVRSSGVDAAISTNDVQVVLTTQSTDLVLAAAQSYAPDNPSLAGTVFINNVTFNSQIYDVSEVTAGASSTTVTMTGEYFSSMAAIAIKAGSGGSTPPSYAGLEQQPSVISKARQIARATAAAVALVGIEAGQVPEAPQPQLGFETQPQVITRKSPVRLPQESIPFAKTTGGSWFEHPPPVPKPQTVIRGAQESVPFRTDVAIPIETGWGFESQAAVFKKRTSINLTQESLPIAAQSIVAPEVTLDFETQPSFIARRKSFSQTQDGLPYGTKVDGIAFETQPSFVSSKRKSFRSQDGLPYADQRTGLWFETQPGLVRTKRLSSVVQESVPLTSEAPVVISVNWGFESWPQPIAKKATPQVQQEGIPHDVVNIVPEPQQPKPDHGWYDFYDKKTLARLKARQAEEDRRNRDIRKWLQEIAERQIVVRVSTKGINAPSAKVSAVQITVVAYEQIFLDVAEVVANTASSESVDVTVIDLEALAARKKKIELAAKQYKLKKAAEIVAMKAELRRIERRASELREALSRKKR